METKNKPLLSIIITCYNDNDYIEQSVQSAINQTYSNKEIVIVDDGSGEKTRRILRKYESAIDLLIFQENQGTSAARNRGIEASKGDYILVLDGDDYIKPELSEKIISTFNKNRNIRMVTSGGRVISYSSNYMFIPTGGDLKQYLIKNCALSAAFKKEDWARIGGYDETMKIGFEDWEFYIRLHDLGGETVVIPEDLYYYRRVEGSRTSRANKNKYKLLEYIYKKHEGLYKENYIFFVMQLLKTNSDLERALNRKTNSVETRIGRMVLKPLRIVRNIFK